MDGNSASRKASSKASMEVIEEQKWEFSASDVVYHFGISGVCVAATTTITHPLDVLKVRLQMQLVGQRGPLTGMGCLFVQLMKSEGPRSLYLGLAPSFMRSGRYGGLRLGLYEPSKYVCELAFESANILVKIASGAFSSVVANALSNPVEVLMVRLQMNPNLRRGAFREMHKIASEEGIPAPLEGVGPAMARAATLTAAQLATYDESKQILMRWTPLAEGFYLDAISGTIAGKVGTILTTPMDMITTHLILQRESKRVGAYKNWISLCVRGCANRRSRRALQRGLAIFARLGPQLRSPWYSVRSRGRLRD